LTEFDVVFFCNNRIALVSFNSFKGLVTFFRIKRFGLLFLEFMPFNSKIFYFAHLTKGGVNIMLIIPIKEGENIDRALKRYKRKFDKTKLFVN
jgi:hypothetical protein